MKKSILFSLFLFSFFISNGQDLIIKKNGDEIKSKVITVSSAEIEYNKFDNLEGPKYKIDKAEIALIIYSNGTKDIFSVQNTTKLDQPTDTINRKEYAQGADFGNSNQLYFSYDFFDRKIPVTFLGIDFSRCKIIGDPIADPIKLFSDINNLFVLEPGKYEMNAAIRKGLMRNQFSLVERLNQNVAVNSLLENPAENISFKSIPAIIETYDFGLAGIKEGIALVLICDNLNKVKNEGAYYYVAIDVSSKKVLFTDRLIGKAGGNGDRNFWARSVYETIREVQEVKYGQWKLMYRK